MGRTYESMMEELEVIEILSTAYDGDEFPGYENIRLSFSQLETFFLIYQSGCFWWTGLPDLSFVGR